MIYLDNSATTKPYPEVLTLYTTISSQYFGNPSSLHSLGMQAEQILNHARKKIAHFLSCQKEQLVFTSGGTEANVFAIKGIVTKEKAAHIITTTVEHASVYETIRHLEEVGHEVTYLQGDAFGRVTVEQVKGAIKKNTVLVSIGHVQGELGTIQPIQELAEMLSAYPRIQFHVDAVQSLLKVSIGSLAKIDLMTLSSHKIHGTNGTGLLYVKNPSLVKSLLHGGGQEQSLRPGSEHVAGIACFAKALEMGATVAEKEQGRLLSLRNRLVHELEQLPGVFINSAIDTSAPHICNISISKIKAEVLVQSLSQEKIYVSTQSACSTKTGAPSRILLGAGHDRERAETAIRISMSFLTTEKEVTTCIEALKRLVPKLQEVT
ncbi:cysteine desulfurase family protein [Shouchella lehensis]|uniref:Cysteine desulfurase n=1 Tax=Shouchella lehensis G1 TaxID=1246626 RepID=A0A060M425_9BACI|nr:cysteine desulfurase family protein [Shouchella lehensis]AIC95308.1 cysteine desulfurase [Shouchella lehensis G1]